MANDRDKSELNGTANEWQGEQAAAPAQQPVGPVQPDEVAQPPAAPEQKEGPLDSPDGGDNGAEDAGVGTTADAEKDSTAEEAPHLFFALDPSRDPSPSAPPLYPVSAPPPDEDKDEEKELAPARVGPHQTNIKNLISDDVEKELTKRGEWSGGITRRGIDTSPGLIALEKRLHELTPKEKIKLLMERLWQGTKLSSGELKVLESLLQTGKCYLDARDKYPDTTRRSILTSYVEGKTLLEYMVLNGDVAALNIALQYWSTNHLDQKADLTNRKFYLLKLAAQHGQTQVVEFLFSDVKRQQGFDPSSIKGAMLAAATAGQYEVVRYLLDQAMTAGLYDNKPEETALFCATSKGHLPIVALLLSHPTSRPWYALEGQYELPIVRTTIDAPMVEDPKVQTIGKLLDEQKVEAPVENTLLILKYELLDEKSQTKKQCYKTFLSAKPRPDQPCEWSDCNFTANVYFTRALQERWIESDLLPVFEKLEKGAADSGEHLIYTKIKNRCQKQIGPIKEAIFKALQNGNEALVQSLITHSGWHPNDFNLPLVAYAAFLKHWELVKWLVERGADINQAYRYQQEYTYDHRTWRPPYSSDDEGHWTTNRCTGQRYLTMTALYLAVDAGREADIEFLVAHGANANVACQIAAAVGQEGCISQTALQLAKAEGDEEIVRRLQPPAQSQSESKLAEPPLTTVEPLADNLSDPPSISAAPQVSTHDEMGSTTAPAVESKDESDTATSTGGTAEPLQQFLPPSNPNVASAPPLLIAFSGSTLARFEKAKSAAYVNPHQIPLGRQANTEYLMALMCNAHPLSEAESASVGALLAKGAFYIDARDTQEKTPLEYAVENGHLDTFVIILKEAHRNRLFPLRELFELQQKVLKQAAASGNIDVVRALLLSWPRVMLEANELPVGLSQTFSEALQVALKNNHDEVFKLLVLNLKAEHHESCGVYRAASLLAASGNVKLIEWLHSQGIDLTTSQSGQDGYGTPLLEAAKAGHLPVVQCLLDHGVTAGLNNETNPKESALFYAVKNKHFDVAALLIEHPKVQAWSVLKAQYELPLIRLNSGKTLFSKTPTQTDVEGLLAEKEGSAASDGNALITLEYVFKKDGERYEDCYLTFLRVKAKSGDEWIPLQFKSPSYFTSPVAEGASPSLTVFPKQVGADALEEKGDANPNEQHALYGLIKAHYQKGIGSLTEAVFEAINQKSDAADALVKQLLESGKWHPDDIGPLVACAAFNGRDALVMWLVNEKGADVDKPHTYQERDEGTHPVSFSFYRCSALFYAARQGNWALVQFLVAHRANVHQNAERQARYANKAPYDIGPTDILTEVVCKSGHVEIVKCLLDKGANWEQVIYTAYYERFKHPDLFTAMYMHEQVNDPGVVERHTENTLLHIAYSTGQVGALMRLLLLPKCTDGVKRKLNSDKQKFSEMPFCKTVPPLVQQQIKEVPAFVNALLERKAGLVEVAINEGQLEIGLREIKFGILASARVPEAKRDAHYFSQLNQTLELLISKWWEKNQCAVLADWQAAKTDIAAIRDELLAKSMLLEKLSQVRDRLKDIETECDRNLDKLALEVKAEPAEGVVAIEQFVPLEIPADMVTAIPVSAPQAPGGPLSLQEAIEGAEHKDDQDVEPEEEQQEGEVKEEKAEDEAEEVAKLDAPLQANPLSPVVEPEAVDEYSPRQEGEAEAEGEGELDAGVKPAMDGDGEESEVEVEEEAEDEKVEELDAAEGEVPAGDPQEGAGEAPVVDAPEDPALSADPQPAEHPLEQRVIALDTENAALRAENAVLNERHHQDTQLIEAQGVENAQLQQQHLQDAQLIHQMQSYIAQLQAQLAASNAAMMNLMAANTAVMNLMPSPQVTTLPMQLAGVPVVEASAVREEKMVGLALPQPQPALVPQLPLSPTRSSSSFSFAGGAPQAALVARPAAQANDADEIVLVVGPAVSVVEIQQR